MSLRRQLVYDALFVLAIALALAWVAVSRAQTPPTVTHCWVHPDQVWQVEVTISGLPVDVQPYTVTNDTGIPGVKRCADIPGLVEPYAFDCRTFNADGEAACVLPDGSQGPLRVWGWRRADLNGNGVVDLPDIGVLLARWFGRSGS